MTFFETVFGPELFEQIRPVVEGPYEEFLRAAVDRAKSVSKEAETKYGIGQEDSWSFDQDAGTLRLEFSDHAVEAVAEIIGSYSFQSESWMWAWANADVDERLTAASSQTRAFGESKGFEDLTNAQWSGTESDAWVMSAAALYVAGGIGLYGGLFGPGRAMFLVKSIVSRR
jgi:hypothetical protein